VSSKIWAESQKPFPDTRHAALSHYELSEYCAPHIISSPSTAKRGPPWRSLQGHQFKKAQAASYCGLEASSVPHYENPVDARKTHAGSCANAAAVCRSLRSFIPSCALLINITLCRASEQTQKCLQGNQSAFRACSFPRCSEAPYYNSANAGLDVCLAGKDEYRRPCSACANHA